MILKNRVLAKSGPREKEGIVRHYRFDNTKIEDHALVWGTHFPNAENVGKFENMHFTSGNLVADVNIDESKMTDDMWKYLWDHPDASIGYEYSLTEENGVLYQDIDKIKHVTIGIEDGVCSTPECGLSTGADSKISYIKSKGVLKMSNEGPLAKHLEDAKKILALEADKVKLEGQLKTQAESLEGIETFKKDSESLAKIREAEKKALVKELVTATGKEESVFAGDSLEALTKFRSLLPTTPPDNSGTIILSGGGDEDRPEGMPKKATVTFYGSKWDKRKPRSYVM